MARRQHSPSGHAGRDDIAAYCAQADIEGIVIVAEARELDAVRAREYREGQKLNETIHGSFAVDGRLFSSRLNAWRSMIRLLLPNQWRRRL